MIFKPHLLAREFCKRTKPLPYVVTSGWKTIWCRLFHRQHHRQMQMFGWKHSCPLCWWNIIRRPRFEED